MVQEAELVRLRRARYIPDIPDTLYMVDEKPRAMGAVGVDILAAALPGNIILLLLLKFCFCFCTDFKSICGFYGFLSE